MILPKGTEAKPSEFSGINGGSTHRWRPCQRPAPSILLLRGLSVRRGNKVRGVLVGVGWMGEGGRAGPSSRPWVVRIGYFIIIIITTILLMVVIVFLFS